MQVSGRIHKLKIPFTLQIGPGKTLRRFVNLFVINAKNLCLIDGGVAGAKEVIFSYIKNLNRQPGEIKMLVLTHAHPDHIGGAAGIKSATGCQVAAHAADIPWIEDVELQYRQRPVPGFNTIVEGSLKSTAL